MTDEKLPFHSFSFTLLENKRPRASLRMTVSDGGGDGDGKGDGEGKGEGGLYDLSVQRGSAANPTSQFTRQVPREVAERLRDAMQRAGVFGWDASYGDETAPGSRRWTLSVVFQEGVFSIDSKGGSDVPSGFDELLEELYRLDFPRPVAQRAGAAAPGAAAAQAPSLNAGGLDFSQLADMLKGSGLPGIDADSLSGLGAAGLSPQELEGRMKQEFRRLSPAEQSQLLDALAATGLASRAFWERFFRG